MKYKFLYQMIRVASCWLAVSKIEKGHYSIYDSICIFFNNVLQILHKQQLVLQNTNTETGCEALEYNVGLLPGDKITPSHIVPQLNTSPVITKALHVVINLLCGTVSNAFWKFKYTTSIGYPWISHECQEIPIS